MYSDRSASEIISTHKADIENQPPVESVIPKQAATQFSTGIKLVSKVDLENKHRVVCHS